VFKITPDGVETVLYSFAGGADRRRSGGRIDSGCRWNFYGTTRFGANSVGTVFRITPDGIETVLASFSDIRAVSPSTLIQDGDGNFFCTTSGGGANGGGSVFKITPAGVKTVLHSFRVSAPIDWCGIKLVARRDSVMAQAMDTLRVVH